MNTSIQFYTRNVYGKQNIYIASEEMARAIATLTRRKTVDTRDLEALKSLGFTLEQIPEPVKPIMPAPATPHVETSGTPAQ